MSFELQTGINISHWLSQSDMWGKERCKQFTKEDVQRVSDIGFDHVRLPIDEVHMWTEDGQIDLQAFDLLNEAIYRLSKQNIRSIVDMHILRSHYFNAKVQPKLYSDHNEVIRFSKLWQDISKHIGEWPTDMLAYEILNEPKAENSDDWNSVSKFIISEIRNIEKTRTLILGSNWYCKSDTFNVLNIPDDSHLYLTFHFYDPMLITHHKATWTNIGGYNGPIQYPGQPVAQDDLVNVPQPLKNSIINENASFDRDMIIERIQQPLSVRQKTGKTIFCGEFGCIHNTPDTIRKKWYKDIISVFTEYNIPYTHWDYKGEFGIFEKDCLNTEIINILKKKML